MANTFQCEVGGRTLTIEVGRLAVQANGAVTVRYGDSLVLVTACASTQPREGVDFLPLTIDYEERLYAAGKIPGSFFRREGRPSQEATLSARLIDRPLRPLFPKGFRNDIQVVVTVLSADQENTPEIISIIGASAALSISDIPFQDPISGTRMGYIDGELVVNPTYAQLVQSKLDLVVAGSKDAVVMVEAGAKEVPEDVILQAVKKGQEVNQEVIRLQEEMVRVIGKPKMTFVRDETLAKQTEESVATLFGKRIEELIERGDAKSERNVALDALESEALEKLGETFAKEQIAAAFKSQLKKVVRARILERRLRPDGRSPDEIRPITAQVGLLPRAHGSGLFNRGMTQVLTIATLGSMGEEQTLDTISPEESKRFMHHYNFPPFSTGEVKRVGSPGRREIGHGALAERAILPMIPDEEEFPYTIRLVSEVLSSNGSTSMASVCGSTLALMDAGVPISAPVAGAAMGLVKEDEDYQVLTDIQGIEDFLGDMDFKVAGTAQGITALQMDIKIKGINYAIMEDALSKARKARLFILGKINETIESPRSELSPFAPRMLRMTIPVEKIGAVIGPGGKTIRSIIEATKTTIDIENDGSVVIGSPNEENARRAMERIKELTREVEVGTIYTGKVTRTMNFGAFVEVLPGKEGLVHISELAEQRVSSVEDVVKVGDEVTVMVTEIDRMGRVNLSRRAVLEGRTGGAAAAPGEAPHARPQGPSPMRGPGQSDSSRGPRPGPGRGGPRPWDRGGYPRRDGPPGQDDRR